MAQAHRSSEPPRKKLARVSREAPKSGGRDMCTRPTPLPVSPIKSWKSEKTLEEVTQIPKMDRELEKRGYIGKLGKKRNGKKEQKRAKKATNIFKKCHLADIALVVLVHPSLLIIPIL